MSLLDKRIHIKPIEYPIFDEYVSAFQKSYWVHDEYSFTEDVQDYHTRVNDIERSAIKNCMLAISQVEVSVKTYFLKLAERFPKPEVASAAVVAAETEVRHMRAYSHLLEILGLNKEFEKIYEIAAINDRLKFLDKYITRNTTSNAKDFVKSMAIFSIFTEHVSLFTQFVILKSFQRERAIFKGVSNVVSSTRAEEDLHGKLIIDIINILRNEFPEWFDTEFDDIIYEACNKAFKAEQKMLDWILEAGELSFLPRVVLEEFIKDRFNTDLIAIGLKPLWETDKRLLKELEWFNVETIGTPRIDFFAARPTDYNIGNKAITANDLF